MAFVGTGSLGYLRRALKGGKQGPTSNSQNESDVTVGDPHSFVWTAVWAISSCNIYIYIIPHVFVLQKYEALHAQCKVDCQKNPAITNGTRNIGHRSILKCPCDMIRPRNYHSTWSFSYLLKTRCFFFFVGIGFLLSPMTHLQKPGLGGRPPLVRGVHLAAALELHGHTLPCQRARGGSRPEK